MFVIYKNPYIEDSYFVSMTETYKNNKIIVHGYSVEFRDGAWVAIDDAYYATDLHSFPFYEVSKRASIVEAIKNTVMTEVLSALQDGAKMDGGGK